MKKFKFYGLPEKIKLEKTNNFKNFILIALVGSCLTTTAGKICDDLEMMADLEYLKSNANGVFEQINLTVSTNNIQNKYYNDDRRTNNTINTRFIKEGTDIIGTQETTKKAVDDLKPITEEHNYNITGSYRWGDNIIGQLLTISNEANAIIAKDDIYMSETIRLPWLPTNKEEFKQAYEKNAFTPRIATHCEIGRAHV